MTLHRTASDDDTSAPEVRPTPRVADGVDYRCGCRRLLARHRDGQVWLRCPRCKREVALDHAARPEQRCQCGRLLARVNAAFGAPAIRCPRCKQEHVHLAEKGWRVAPRDSR
ncbi:MAG: hypothetical protein AAF928_11845 [Myxococcota bacterium]